MPNQPAANQDVPDDGLYCAVVDPPDSLLGAKDMVGCLSVTLIIFKLAPSKLENSRTQSNTTDHQALYPKLVFSFFLLTDV
jgi:hypothetical protein